MNKQQKQVLQSQLNLEKITLHNLKNTYKAALDKINDNIAKLQARTDVENMQAIIYQKQYQEALKQQINGILDTLNGEQFATVSDYLQKSYEDGFVGTIYDLHGQGLPFIFPIDQKQVVKAITLDTKLSKTLYKSLGENITNLKIRIKDSISRGIATNAGYSDMAKEITRYMVGDYSGMKGGALGKAMQIARTESHRITNEATHDAQTKAKENGADVVKQWDAAMDKRTRPHHAQLDGQLREIDENFEVSGRTALYPGGFGIASEDINCRCAVLQRAKWALDEDELQTLKDRAEYFGLDKTDSFEEFKKKYIDVIQKDPNEGKVFHMLPDGTFAEGEIPGVETVQINGLTGDVTIIKPGADYKQITWSMNDDGTLSPGIVKYQAQYKIDIDDYKILNVDMNKAVSDHLKWYGNNFNDDAAKFETMFNALPKDLQNEIFNSYNLTNQTLSDAIYDVLKQHGYEGVYFDSTADEFETFFKLFDDSKITKTKKSKLETLTASLTKEQKKLSKIDNKTYSGIWKDDVKVSDYSLKKGSIQAKRDWYLQQIASGSPKSATYQKYLDDLDEFEKLGSEYEKQSLKIKKIQSDIKKFTPKTADSSLDAFTQERKDNALWFDQKHGGFSAADKYFDPPAKTIHASATKGEQNGFYTYTQGSGGHNRPLAGFQKPWNRSGTGWEEQFYVGPKKVWIDYEGKGDQIRNLTTLIEKSVYDKDVWLQSGQGFGTIEGFLNIPKGTLQNMTDADFQQFIGHENIFEQFLSTAVNKGGGGMFNGKPLKMNIYAPEGSQMLYASDVGAYGKGENEMILQRGGTYKITKMYWGNDPTDGNRRKIFVDMELHPEKGYDLFQQDPNEWTGSRANYRNP